MGWLTVINGPDQGEKVKIKPSGTFIGRDAAKCDLVLTETKVSRVHAKVAIISDNSIKIEDCHSRNGILLNGKRIEGAVILHPGEVVEIGNCQIRYDVMSNYTPSGGHTRALQLSAGILKIGRDPSNDIVLNHPLVSRFHARIVSNTNSRYLEDLHSTNGTFVNGKRVIGATQLLPSSLVQICGYRYYFDGNTLIEYDETSGQVRIEVEQLTKTVNLPKGEKRVLLDDISLVIEPREFVAILGGSGAGKSTLMGALTAMNPATAGRVLVNGRDLYSEYNSFRSMIGYVPQDDIIHTELTVKEVLTYSARLRMTDDVTELEINRAVDTVIADLELTPHRDVVVKNLSGGQRKRVSIGVELLTRPSLFFLDEPTSGLDPGLEKVMMELLRKLADQGRIIVLVTHATSNIKLCDKVVFLTRGGKLAFMGTPKEALTYFGVDDFADIYKKISMEKTADQWAGAFMHSSIHQKYLGNRFKNTVAASLNKIEEAPHNVHVRTSAIKQWWIITSRYAQILLADRRNLLILLLQPIIIAGLIWMVYLHNAPLFQQSTYHAKELEITQQVFAEGQYEEVKEKIKEEETRRSNMRVCVTLMVLTSIWLGTSNAAREITKEMPVYKRERLVKLRIAPYLLSKVAVQSLICLAQSLLLVAVITLGLGLPYLLTNVTAFFLISFASMVMGLTVSAIATNMDKAQSAVQLLLIPQIILSGSIIPMAKVTPEVFQNVFHLAISKWGYELVGGGICKINDKVALAKPLPELTGDFTGHWLALVTFAVILYGVTTVAMLQKDKRRY